MKILCVVLLSTHCFLLSMDAKKTNTDKEDKVERRKYESFPHHRYLQHYHQALNMMNSLEKNIFEHPMQLIIDDNNTNEMDAFALHCAQIMRLPIQQLDCRNIIKRLKKKGPFNDPANHPIRLATQMFERRLQSICKQEKIGNSDAAVVIIHNLFDLHDQIDNTWHPRTTFFINNTIKSLYHDTHIRLLVICPVKTNLRNQLQEQLTEHTKKYIRLLSIESTKQKIEKLYIKVS